MTYRSSKPTVQGGDLVIKGTRIPIAAILYRLKTAFVTGDASSLPAPTMITLTGAIGEAIDLLAPRLHGKEMLQT